MSDVSPDAQGLLARIERAAFRAWPAPQNADVAGWHWRFADGAGSRRANSTAALAFSGTDVEAAIDAVESRYAGRGAAAMFQISDVSQPADLDQRLADRGYAVVEPCVTLVAEIADVLAPMGIEYFDVATPAWFDCYSSVITPARRATAPQILSRIPKPAAFCGVVRGGRVIATALAVAHDGIVIAECVATDVDARKTGAASAVMRGVAAWGAEQGCTIAALQAVAANAPAQALYRSLGYRPMGSYHMRVGPG
jgi:N-acetylglutamate synthase